MTAQLLFVWAYKHLVEMFLISMLWGVSKEGELSPGGVSNTVGSFKYTASDKLFFSHWGESNALFS